MRGSRPSPSNQPGGRHPVSDDNSGVVVGGLLGHRSLGLLFLDLLHLPAELRGCGFGDRIIALASRRADAGAASLRLSIR